MRYPRNKQIYRGQLDVAAFASVFFIVLIFVLLHSQLVFTPGVPIRLPVANDLPGVRGRTLVVAIDAGGQYYFDNQRAHERVLRRRLTEAVAASHEPVTLVIQADKSVSWDRIIELWNLARSAGVKDAVGATRPSPSTTAQPPSLPTR